MNDEDKVPEESKLKVEAATESDTKVKETKMDKTEKSDYSVDDPVMQRSGDELRRLKLLHSLLMILGWVNLSLGVTLLLVTLLVAFLIPVQYAVSPCTGGNCFVTYMIPFITSFVTFVVALGQFWGAERLEQDKYCETGMWISFMLVIPFVVIIFYMLVTNFAQSRDDLSYAPMSNAIAYVT